MVASLKLAVFGISNSTQQVGFALGAHPARSHSDISPEAGLLKHPDCPDVSLTRRQKSTTGSGLCILHAWKDLDSCDNVSDRATSKPVYLLLDLLSAGREMNTVTAPSKTKEAVQRRPFNKGSISSGAGSRGRSPACFASSIADV